jgi:hypothetical protein
VVEGRRSCLSGDKPETLSTVRRDDNNRRREAVKYRAVDNNNRMVSKPIWQLFFRDTNGKACNRIISFTRLLCNPMEMSFFTISILVPFGQRTPGVNNAWYIHHANGFELDSLLTLYGHQAATIYRDQVLFR